MSFVTATFQIPGWIAEGLAVGDFERVGGVIREVGSKQVVAWLRESGSFQDIAQAVFPLPAAPVTSALSTVTSLANTAITTKGLSDVNHKIGDVELAITALDQNMHQFSGLAHVTSAASVLNFGVAAIGFTVIAQRLKDIEQRLQQAQEVLKKLDRKIDLSFYANFRAALDLAANAFTMNKPENRRSSALAAINRFLEAEHVYTDYVDEELELKSQITDEYLLTLALAYVAEARCYLELEEWETALRRFSEGTEKIRSCLQKYIDILLTSNPAAFLHAQHREAISLSRLTKVYQWLDPAANEVSVFELLRENLFSLEKEQSAQSGHKWVASLPPAVVSGVEVKGGIFGNKEEMKQEAMKRLPAVIELMESMIETSNRFESYQTEVKAIAQSGMSFHEWRNLAPAEPHPQDTNLMYLLPSTPLEL